MRKNLNAPVIYLFFILITLIWVSPLFAEELSQALPETNQDKSTNNDKKTFEKLFHLGLGIFDLTGKNTVTDVTLEADPTNASNNILRYTKVSEMAKPMLVLNVYPSDHSNSFLGQLGSFNNSRVAKMGVFLAVDIDSPFTKKSIPAYALGLTGRLTVEAADEYKINFGIGRYTLQGLEILQDGYTHGQSIAKNLTPTQKRTLNGYMVYIGTNF